MSYLSDLAVYLTGKLNPIITAVNSNTANKVDKVAGYGLSQEDFTTALLNKLNGIEAGAQTNQNAVGAVTDGSNTYTAASETDSITFTGAGGLSVSVNSSTGEITFDASGANYTLPAATGSTLGGVIVGSGLNVNAGGTISVDTASIATQSYVDTQVANLVNSAPATLDTLNELAAALGDDPNFATTISTQIGNIQSELDTTQTGAGLNADGTLAAFTGANYISGSGSLRAALVQLDTSLDSVASDVATNASDIATLQSNSTSASGDLTTLFTGTGLTSGSGYTAHTGIDFITSADFTAASLTESLHNADRLLSEAITNIGTYTEFQTYMDANLNTVN